MSETTDGKDRPYMLLLFVLLLLTLHLNQCETRDRFNAIEDACGIEVQVPESVEGER